MLWGANMLMLRGLNDEWRAVHKSESKRTRLSLETSQASCFQMPMANCLLLLLLLLSCKKCGTSGTRTSEANENQSTRLRGSRMLQHLHRSFPSLCLLTKCSREKVEPSKRVSEPIRPLPDQYWTVLTFFSSSSGKSSSFTIPS